MSERKQVKQYLDTFYVLRYFIHRKYIFCVLPARYLPSPIKTVTIEDSYMLPPSCHRNEKDPWPLYTYNLDKKPSLYIIAVSQQNINLALSYLDSTITLCPDKVKPGAFNQENIILFLLSNPKEGKNSTEKAIFSNII